MPSARTPTSRLRMTSSPTSRLKARTPLTSRSSYPRPRSTTATATHRYYLAPEDRVGQEAFRYPRRHEEKEDGRHRPCGDGKARARDDAGALRQGHHGDDAALPP